MVQQIVKIPIVAIKTCNNIDTMQLNIPLWLMLLTKNTRKILGTTQLKIVMTCSTPCNNLNAGIVLLNHHT